ncbi:cytochrome b5 reductase 4-like isoform X2 [Babylonia areolata]
MANNSLFPAANSQQRLSAGASPSLGRNKVMLKPGRSLMDWIRLGRSSQDLTGVGGKVLTVTKEELSKHNKPEDAWIALRGKVYNLTPYLEYHPGGVEELMRGAGIDGTQLFDEIHKWVNAESMLEKCLVGRLETESPVFEAGLSRKGSNQSQRVDSNGSIKSPAAFKPPAEPQSPTYDWFQSSKAVTLVVYTRSKKVNSDHVTISKTDRNLRVAVSIEKYTFKIHQELQEDVTTDYTVKVHPESGKVEIVLPKSEPDKQWPCLGKPLRGDKSYIKTFQAETVYRECTVQSIAPVTHDVILLTIRPPEGCRLPVPIGHHVQIKHKVSGMEVARSYTAVLPSLDEDRQDPDMEQGRTIYLMIKIYPNGAVTPFIGTLNAGDMVSISNQAGSFDVSRLSGVTHLVMLAAGTGVTPMLRLIYHTVVMAPKDSDMEVLLVFYNKKSCDIMWREELDALAAKYSRFKVTYILSDEPSWTGLKGRVCSDHIYEFVPFPSAGDNPEVPSAKSSLTSQAQSDVSEIPEKPRGSDVDGVGPLLCVCGPTAPTKQAPRKFILTDVDGLNPLVCVCGPTPFANLATQLLKNYGLSHKHIHLFQG